MYPAVVHPGLVEGASPVWSAQNEAKGHTLHRSGSLLSLTKYERWVYR
jgi:hypothetical protein